MRDIKSNNRSTPDANTPDDLPEDAKELYKKRLPKNINPRLTGSSVGVTNIHVPRSQLPVKKRVINQTIKKSEPAQLRETVPKTAPKRSKTKGARLSYRERKIAAVLLGLVSIAVLLAIVIFLPKAGIQLVLETAPLLVDQKLTLASTSDNAADIIPATAYVREVRVEGVSPVVSTAVVGSKATGNVTLINRTTQEQPIKENSRLLTSDNKLFYMKKSAIIPAGSDGAISQMSVPVEAAEPGAQGNVTSGRLNFAALDSSSQSVVYAEVSQPLTGGAGEEVKIVKESDIEQARTNAQAAARQKVEEEIRNELQNGWIIMEESWNATLQDFDIEGAVNDQVETLSYSGQILVRVMSYEETTLTSRLQQALESRLDENYMLFPGPVSFTKSVDNIDWDKSEAQVTVRVTHTTIPTFSLETLRDKLAGRTEEEATAYLNGLKGVKSVSVDLSPFWVKHIPRIDKRIVIDLRSDR